MFLTKTLTKPKSGFTLVEVLLAMVLFVMFATGFAYVAIDTLQKDTKVTMEDEALAYAQEGIEAVRAIRAENFLALKAGTYGLSFTNDKWSLIATPETIDSFFKRSITIKDVYRDSNGNIVASGGTIDLESKKIITEVAWTWRSVLPRTAHLETLLTNWAGDDLIQTMCNEWTAGTAVMIDVNATASPPLNNCALRLSQVEAPSNFYSSLDIGEHGNDVEVDGTIAYLAGAKTHEGLIISDISDVEQPFIIKKLDLGQQGRSVVKAGDYLYMGMDSGSKGFAIVDVSDPAQPVAKSVTNIGAAGNRGALAGAYLYIGTEANTNSFKIIKISNPAAPALVKSVNVDGKVKAVAISGNYAYVAVENADKGLQVIDIADPVKAKKVAQLDIDAAGRSIVIEGNYAYVGTVDDESLKVVNITVPFWPVKVAELNVEHEAQDLSIQGNYLYAALNSDRPGVAVVRLHNTPKVTLAFTMDTAEKTRAVDTNEKNVFLAVDTSNEGLIIMGTAKTDVASNGNFTTQPLDIGSEDVRYNLLKWEATVTPGGSLRLQIRTAASAEGLDSATWVGPDGTGNSYYVVSPTAIMLHEGRSGQRYAQIKLFMTSDTVTSSTVESVTLNYTL